MILTIAWGFTPAKPGVNTPEWVKRQARIMSDSYTQGGLAAKMQRVKAANIEVAANGLRDLREDVYMSFPVILGSYNNRNDDTTVASELQMELFDGPWPTITMAEHYEQMSYGQFHLSGQVYGWYELPHASSFYEGGTNGLETWPPGGTGDFLRESLDLADMEVDFSQFDNDGPDGTPNSGDDDGYVDAAFFVHSGPGGEGGGSGIHSHRYRYSAWFGSSYITNDTGFNGQAIRVDDYIIQPAVSTSGAGVLIEIGVFSHEFGHALGLPDLYDTDYSSDGVGSWCLMASGSWSSPSSPVHMSAWCKEMLGWIIPVIPNQNIENFEFPNVEENSFAVKLWTHGELEPYIGNYSHGQDVGQEYYLIENRQRLGSEQSLPGTGLMIWHVDNAVRNNDDENHRMVDVKAADGHFNGSNSGDSWPGSTNNRNFDFETIPSSIGWAGVNTEVAIRNISDSQATMLADIEIYESIPRLNLTDMLVSDFDGDNIFAPGENVLLWLIVENSGGLTTNPTATLSVDGSAVQLIDSVITFNSIDFQATSTSNQAFEFNISDTLSPQSVSFDVSFDSDEHLEPDLAEFELLLGIPDIVVIDDDGVIEGSGDYQAHFKNALNAVDLVHVVWDVAQQGLPDLDWLNDYSSVIWFSGDDAAPLDEISSQLISDYLDLGGNVLLTGQNMAHGNMDLGNFLREYFAIEVLDENINTPNVYGDPHHEFFDLNDRFFLTNPSGTQNQANLDSYTILDGGSSIFMYPVLGGASAGSSVKNETYSAIILGFGLEALGHSGSDAATTQGLIIERLLDWMGTPATSLLENPHPIPEHNHISAGYPNPFNPATTFDLQLPSGGNGILQIINIRGRMVETFDINHSGSVRWEPSSNLSGGVYFARFQVDGQAAGDLQKITYLK